MGEFSVSDGPRDNGSAELSRRHRTAPGRPVFGPLLLVCGLALSAFVVLTLLIAPYARQAPVSDLRVSSWVSAHRTGGLTALARVLTWLGSAPVLIAVAVAAAMWLWRVRQRSSLAAVFAAAVATTAGIVALVKIAVARHRPNSADLLGPPALDYSFPSGHTTNSAVVYVLLAIAIGRAFDHRRRLLVAPMILLAIGIGCSRVYLGYHYSSDVLGGWLFATAVVTGVITSLRALDRRRRSVTTGRSTIPLQADERPMSAQRSWRSTTS